MVEEEEDEVISVCDSQEEECGTHRGLAAAAVAARTKLGDVSNLACFGVVRGCACANGGFDVADVCAQAQVAWCVVCAAAGTRGGCEALLGGGTASGFVWAHPSGSPSTLEPNVYPGAWLTFCPVVSWASAASGSSSSSRPLERTALVYIFAGAGGC